MSFSIILYKNEKRINSTKQPSGESRTLQGVLRDDCDIINPIISCSFAGPFNQQLQRPVPMTSEFNPCDYNYAVISEWNRSYFIDSWEWSGGLWWAHMSVDVLGTYVQDIENWPFYITRCEHSDELYIADDKYVDKMTYTSMQVAATGYSKPYTTNINSGIFLIGVLGGSSGTTIYILSAGQYHTILASLFPNASQNLDVWINQQLGQAVVGGLNTIMSNIVFIKWIPFQYNLVDVSSRTTMVPFKVGNYDLAASFPSLTGNAVYETNAVYTFSPRNSSSDPDGLRGMWEYLAPHSRYYIYIPPIGKIELDPTLVLGANFKVCANIKLNLASGLININIYYGIDKTGTLQGSYTYDLSLNLKAGGQSSVNVGSLVGMVSSVAAAVATENPALLAGGVKSATELFHAPSGSTGGGGTLGFAPNIMDDPVCEAIYYHIAEENKSEWGRPFCKTETIETVGQGFVQVAEGDIAIQGATTSELQKIKQFLETGIYYE